MFEYSLVIISFLVGFLFGANVLFWVVERDIAKAKRLKKGIYKSK
jgi:hypothetical protein